MKNPVNETGSTRLGGNGNRPTAGGASSASGRAQEGAERLKDTAIEKVEETRDRARESMEQGRQRVADRIRRVGSLLRDTSGSLKEEDQLVARYAEMASERIEQAARYVNQADFKGVVRDAEHFARTRPALFFGGAFLIGLAAGRFLKSSQERGFDGGGSGMRQRVADDELEGVFDPETASGTAGALPSTEFSSRDTPPGGFSPMPGTTGIGGIAQGGAGSIPRKP